MKFPELSERVRELLVTISSALAPTRPSSLDHFPLQNCSSLHSNPYHPPLPPNSPNCLIPKARALHVPRPRQLQHPLIRIKHPQCIHIWFPELSIIAVIETRDHFDIITKLLILACA